MTLPTTCTCGNPAALNVEHRQDGPCHVHDQPPFIDPTHVRVSQVFDLEFYPELDISFDEHIRQHLRAQGVDPDAQVAGTPHRILLRKGQGTEGETPMPLKIDKVAPRKKGERDSRTIVVSIPTHELLMKESERTGRSVRWLADAAVAFAFQDKKPEGAA